MAEVQGTDIVLLGSLEGLSNTSVFSQNINLNTHWLYQTKEVTATNLQITPVALEAHLEVVSFEAGFLAANSFYNTRCI